jgi:hypothetical protein
VIIPKKHQQSIPEVVSPDNKLRDSVVITSDPPGTPNRTFKFKMDSYLNRREQFQVLIYFDGPTVPCEVRCRHKDTKVKIRTGEYVSTRPKLRMYIAAITIGLLMFALMFVVIIFTRANIDCLQQWLYLSLLW